MTSNDPDSMTFEELFEFWAGTGSYKFLKVLKEKYLTETKAKLRTNRELYRPLTYLMSKAVKDPENMIVSGVYNCTRMTLGIMDIYLFGDQHNNEGLCEDESERFYSVLKREIAMSPAYIDFYTEDFLFEKDVKKWGGPKSKFSKYLHLGDQLMMHDIRATDIFVHLINLFKKTPTKKDFEKLKMLIDDYLAVVPNPRVWYKNMIKKINEIFEIVFSFEEEGVPVNNAAYRSIMKLLKRNVLANSDSSDLIIWRNSLRGSKEVYANCRFHYIDIRSLIVTENEDGDFEILYPELSEGIIVTIDNDQYVTSYIKSVEKYERYILNLIAKIPVLKKEVSRSFLTVEEVKLFIRITHAKLVDEFISKLGNNFTRVKIEDARDISGLVFILLQDIYTVARMFKEFVGDILYVPSNIVVYVGDLHRNAIETFLLYKGAEIVERSTRQDNLAQCLDCVKFPLFVYQP